MGQAGGDAAGVDVLAALGPVQRLAGLFESGLAAPVEPPGIREAVELSLMVLLAGAHPVVAGAAEGEAALLEPGGLEQLPEGSDRVPERSRVRDQGVEDQGVGFLAAARRDPPVDGAPQQVHFVSVVTEGTGELDRHRHSGADEGDEISRGEAAEPAVGAGQGGVVLARDAGARLVDQPVSVLELEAIMVVPVQDDQVRGEEHPPLRDLIGGEAVGQDQPLDQMGGQRQDIGGGGPHRVGGDELLVHDLGQVLLVHTVGPEDVEVAGTVEPLDQRVQRQRTLGHDLHGRLGQDLHGCLEQVIGPRRIGHVSTIARPPPDPRHRQCDILARVEAGAIIQAVRRRSGLSQAELARRAGTSQPVISAYEHGRRDPTLGTLRKLVEAGGERLQMDAVVPGSDLPLPADPREHARRLLEVLTLADAIPARRRSPVLIAPRLVSV